MRTTGSLLNGCGLLSLICLLAAAAPASAKEDIEFVQEHLPEVAMDNRYATLPFWGGAVEDDGQPQLDLQAGYTLTGAGALKIRGPLLSVRGDWQVSGRWRVGALAFYDKLELRGDREERELQTLFAPSTPLVRPNAAVFTGLNGTATDLGLGVTVSKRAQGGVLGMHEWLGGVLWQSVQLEDYRFGYLLQSGPQSGTAGTIDFDAQYDHFVPFGGLGLLRDYGDWSTDLHALVAYPMPRRGIRGHITGPGFDIHGDSADAGNGKHFGDPSVTVGYTLTYQPAHLSFDLGTLITQALLEPRIHPGIDRNLLLSFSLALK
ncbi:MAG: hypothetical protein SXG53_20355 [Pseudomonadota bacterium]|nr:hypothetical protein [Pseudomonadota bacterium]